MKSFGRAFEPLGASQALAVTAAAQTVNLAAPLSDIDGTVRLCNIGDQVVFVTLDGSAPTTASMALVPNSAESFAMPAGKTAIKAIAAATGSNLYVTPGRGV